MNWLKNTFSQEDNLILAGIIVIFVMATTLNYDALRDFALEEAHVTERLSYIVPILFDFFIFVGVWVTLRNKRYGEPARLAWTIVIVFTIFSIALNLMHYPQQLGGWSLAVIVPLVIFFSAELGKGLTDSRRKRQTGFTTLTDLTRQIEQARHALSGQQLEIEQAATKVAELAEKRQSLEQTIADLQREKRRVGNGKPTDTTDETRARAYAILAERPDISGAGLGRELGKSESLGRRLKREWTEQQPVSVNGYGAK